MIASRVPTILVSACFISYMAKNAPILALDTLHKTQCSRWHVTVLTDVEWWPYYRYGPIAIMDS